MQHRVREYPGPSAAFLFSGSDVHHRSSPCAAEHRRGPLTGPPNRYTRDRADRPHQRRESQARLHIQGHRTRHCYKAHRVEHASAPFLITNWHVVGGTGCLHRCSTLMKRRSAWSTQPATMWMSLHFRSTSMTTRRSTARPCPRGRRLGCGAGNGCVSDWVFRGTLRARQSPDPAIWETGVVARPPPVSSRYVDSCSFRALRAVDDPAPRLLVFEDASQMLRDHAVLGH